MKKLNFMMPVLFIAVFMLSCFAATAQSKVDNREVQGEKSIAISCHCFGEIECWGFTGPLGANFNWPCKTNAHDAQCCDRVRAKFVSLSAAQKQVIADCMCAKGDPDGYELHVKGSVGAEKTYTDCGKVATLINRPAVIKTTCTCPKGWLANQTNVDGGVTADGKCKRLVCGPLSPSSIPPPPNGTQVGDWGFMWGRELYAWGSAANGGAAICVSVQTSPKVCKLQY